MESVDWGAYVTGSICLWEHFPGSIGISEDYIHWEHIVIIGCFKKTKSLKFIVWTFFPGDSCYSDSKKVNFIKIEGVLALPLSD